MHTGRHPHTSSRPRAIVLLCRDLESSPAGVDAQSVAQWLAARVPSASVHVVTDLCAHPDRAARHLARGASTLVMGLCSRPRSLAPLQAAIRRVGLDPLGVEIVNLGVHAGAAPTALAIEKAAVLVAAAVAKAQAFAGSGPQNLKPALPAAVSRRAIFTLTLLEYYTVPSITSESCRVEQGCALCVHGCPHAALSVMDGEIRVDKTRCTSCGLCVTACPHDAVMFPGAGPAQIDAQIRTLLNPALGSIQPRGIVFTCAHGASALEALAASGAAYPANWLPVEVPCVEMVSSGWLLACVARGAAAVGIVPCPEAGGAGPPGRLEGRVAFCREVLAALGEAEARILLFPTAEDALLSTLRRRLSGPRGSCDSHGLFAGRSSAQVVQVVARGYEAVDLAIAHPYSPFGIVEAADGCTVCGACADACPADALVLQSHAEAELTFDAARCVGCGLCLPACPEPGVLRLRQATDLRSLTAGRVGLRRTAYRRCRACGQPVAPEAMLARIAARLGREYGKVETVIANYCQDCRSASARLGPPGSIA